MSAFLKGMELCENFFADCAKTVIETHFPDLAYSAGLIGYGSDVLGYDDAVSTDHMWGPRFYLFVSERDAAWKEELFRTLSENLPYTYRGYSVNYSEPDPNDCGVRHPERICSGTVHPLLWIQTFDSYLTEQLGVCDLDRISPCEWLAFSEHRLLSLVSGKFFVDGLHCGERIAKIQYYPPVVRRYLIASNWANIAAEQAFVRIPSRRLRCAVPRPPPALPPAAFPAVKGCWRTARRQIGGVASIADEERFYKPVMGLYMG